MIKNMTLGQYFPSDSIIHRLDPRSKLLIALALLVVIFVVKTWLGYGVIAAFLLVVIILSKVSIKFVLKGIRPMWFILLLMFILNIFFIGGETILVDWWIFKISLEGIIKALVLSVRLVLLIASTTILTLTTSPMEITDALERLLSPLKKIRFPANEMALMMSIALRFIPTLMEETDRIMKAQTARGASFDTGGLIARAKGMIPILVPLFISAFKRADELAMAMESRCYNGGKNRTRMKILKFKYPDLIAALLMVGLGVGAFLGL